ncbi:hypothetical protein [Microbacterium sp. G2-8]|uniref:rhamnogalacturonan lyase family protein n=1 Tax=Microbacterium sp. G2-8 TaxID=2842454 RepID=UPI0027E2D466|nr:hypothetical protein [Microbacterium sp. G2-8]
MLKRSNSRSKAGLATLAAGALAVGLGPVATATAADGPADRFFDFQCADGPLAAGHQEVEPGTTYDASLGFGLEAALADDQCRVRGGDDPAGRDFLLPTSSSRFLVDLPNGVYTLVLHTGDGIASSNTGMIANGVELDARSPGSGVIAERWLEDVEVTDGRLDVRFTGSSIRANALEVLTPVEVPSDLRAEVSADLTPTVDLAWAPADGAVAYRVYRSEDGGDPVALGDTVGSATSWTDDGVALARTYTYSVVSLAESGRESRHSEQQTAEVVDPEVAPPAAPSDLRVEETTLRWSAVDGASAYDVFRARGEREPQFVERIDGTEWVDEHVEPTVAYTYQVAAVGTGGRSERSAAADLPASVQLTRQAERLERAPVAVASDEGVYVGWRLLGSDDADTAFHVYRDGERITDEPIVDSTDVVDPDGTTDSTYRVSTAVAPDAPKKNPGRGSGKNAGGLVEHWASAEFGVQDGQALDIPLDKPAGGTTPDDVEYTYRANDASVGDVDGDGEYEYIVKWDPTNSQDNSRSGHTGNVYVDAYELDGTQLWRIDLGRNIRAGAHYTQFQVFDYDGDGRAEVMMKTADGTTDGGGAVIGDASADHRNSRGYVLDGPEFLTVFDGATGEAVDTIDYVPGRGDLGSWGDNYGNRADRFLAGTAYLDGETPSAIFARGYYTRAVVAAFDFDGSTLTQRWVFDSDEAGSEYRGQGNHSLSVADVDSDQKDEIVYGSMTLDDDGTALYNTELGHGDAQHVADVDPARPGLEVFSAHEDMARSGNLGATLRDAGTGEILWSIPADRDTGRAAMGDIDPRYEGAESWAVGRDAAWNSPAGQLRSASGELITTNIPAANFLTFWDGDLLREIGDHDFDDDSGVGVPTIAKWDWETDQSIELYRAEGTFTNNSTKGNASLQADLFGDWREEIVTRTEDSSALRIATTVIDTEHRLFTLMSDSQYRLAVAWQNTAYNQPPHTSDFIGDGMDAPEAPRQAYTTGAPEAERVPGPATEAPGAVTVDVEDAEDGRLRVEASIAEGESNASAFRLLVDGVIVATADVVDTSPSDQQVTLEHTGIDAGEHEVQVVAVNQHGDTSSKVLSVTVR